MYKPPKFMEQNFAPSRLNTSTPTGAVSQLSNQLQDAPQYDGVTIEQMVGNPLYDRTDAIDKLGQAQKEITKNAKIIKSKEKMIRGLNDLAQKARKPSA